MESFLATSAVLTIVAAGLVLIIRRNLRQRATARKFRQIFIATADDLVGKAEFPDAHARHLVSMAAIPQGWLTRFMVLQMVRRMAFGESEKDRRNSDLRLEYVPANLRPLYIKAIFAFLIGDTFRCALLGRIVRGTHGWLFDAIEEIKPDVHAHATKAVIDEVGGVRVPRRFVQQQELACVA